MKSNIISITAQSVTELCNVDVAETHETLLQLPAEKYLELYHMMKDRVENKIYCVPELPTFAKGGVAKGGIAFL